MSASTAPLPEHLHQALRKELSRLAQHEEDVAASEAAHVHYWETMPVTVSIHRHVRLLCVPQPRTSGPIRSARQVCFTGSVWRLLEPLRGDDREAFLALARRSDVRTQRGALSRG